MKIEHLSYLLTIAKCKSISSASRRIFIGQTTLSAILKSIEDELSVKIFLRTYNGVVPTPEGEEVLRFAEEIVSKHDSLLSLFQEKGPTSQHLLNILASATVNCSMSVFLTKYMQTRIPDVSLIFHEPEYTKMVASIMEGIANIGLGHFDDEEIEAAKLKVRNSGVVIEHLFSDSLYLCVAENSKYAHRKWVDINEIAHDKQVTPHYYTETANSSYYNEIYRRIGRSASFTSNKLVKEAVKQCNLIAVLTGTNFILDQEVIAGHLHIIPLVGLENENSLGVYAVHREFGDLTLEERTLLEGAREFFSYATSLNQENHDYGQTD